LLVRELAHQFPALLAGDVARQPRGLGLQRVGLMLLVGGDAGVGGDPHRSSPSSSWSVMYGASSAARADRAAWRCSSVNGTSRAGLSPTGAARRPGRLFGGCVPALGRRGRPGSGWVVSMSVARWADGAISPL